MPGTCLQTSLMFVSDFISGRLLMGQEIKNRRGLFICHLAHYWRIISLFMVICWCLRSLWCLKMMSIIKTGIEEPNARYLSSDIFDVCF